MFSINFLFIGQTHKYTNAQQQHIHNYNENYKLVRIPAQIHCRRLRACVRACVHYIIDCVWMCATFAYVACVITSDLEIIRDDRHLLPHQQQQRQLSIVIITIHIIMMIIMRIVWCDQLLLLFSFSFSFHISNGYIRSFAVAWTMLSLLFLFYPNQSMSLLAPSLYLSLFYTIALLHCNDDDRW